MELFKLLNKYRKSYSLQKMTLYKEVENHKQLILDEGFMYNKKLEIIFLLEIVYKGIENKQKLENAYHKIVSQNHEVFKHLTYQEKQNMINHDIQKVIESIPTFKDNSTIICIPYLEHTVNQRYVEQFQLMTIKKHKDYINQYPRELENVVQLYGMKVFISAFSSLQYVGQDDMHYYFYYAENKTVYIYNEKYQLQEEFCLVDKYHDYVPSMEAVKSLVQEILQTDNDQKVIDSMHKQGFLSTKAHKKISKKLG